MTTTISKNKQSPKYFNQEQFSDCKFRCGTKTIFIHKVVLAPSSSWFRKLLTSEFREATVDEIPFPDVDPEAFSAMLRSLYDLDYASEEAVWHDGITALPHVRVYVLAEQYDLPELKQAAYDNMVKIQQRSDLVSPTKTLPKDVLDFIRELLAGTPTTDILIRPWLVRFCTHHARDLINQEAYRDDFTHILSEHGDLASAILQVHLDDRLKEITVQTCRGAGCPSEWIVDDDEQYEQQQRDACKCDYIPGCTYLGEISDDGAAIYQTYVQVPETSLWDDDSEEEEEEMEDYFNNTDFSDITLRNTKRDFFAHKVILASKSSWFRTTFSERFMKPDQQVVELLGDDPDACEAMLRYLYGLPYPADDAKWHDGVTLEPHVQVYVCADKYNLPELGRAAYTNIADILCKLNLTAPGADPTSFIDAARLVYECLPSRKDALRCFVIRLVAKNIRSWLRHPQCQTEISELLGEFSELGRDILVFQAEQDVSCVVVQRCQECDRPQIQQPGEEIAECLSCGCVFESDKDQTPESIGSGDFKLYYEEPTIDLTA